MSYEKKGCNGVMHVVLSLIFMVAMAGVYAFFFTFPASLLVEFVAPELFASYAQTLYGCALFLFCLFLGITVVSRVAHATLSDSYICNTFYYDFISK